MKIGCPTVASFTDLHVYAPCFQKENCKRKKKKKKFLIGQVFRLEIRFFFSLGYIRHRYPLHNARKQQEFPQILILALLLKQAEHFPNFIVGTSEGNSKTVPIRGFESNT